MLCYLRNNMSALCTPCQRDSAKSQGIALRTTSGKDDLFRLAAKQTCHLLASKRYGLACGMSIAVSTGRIAKLHAQIRLHGLENGWINWRSSIVIKIKRPLLKS